MDKIKVSVGNVPACEERFIVTSDGTFRHAVHRVLSSGHGEDPRSFRFGVAFYFSATN